MKNLRGKGPCGRCLSVSAPPPPVTPYPPTLHTVYVYTCILYTVLIHVGKGGGVELAREKVRGATFDKAGSKIPNMTECITSL